jgi:hypothetical protein
MHECMYVHVYTCVRAWFIYNRDPKSTHQAPECMHVWMHVCACIYVRTCMVYIQQRPEIHTPSTWVHACMCMYIRSNCYGKSGYMHTYMHDIHTTWVEKWMYSCTCIHACTHTYIHTYTHNIHTHIHALHTYIHNIHTYISGKVDVQTVTMYYQQGPLRISAGAPAYISRGPCVYQQGPLLHILRLAKWLKHFNGFNSLSRIIETFQRFSTDWVKIIETFQRFSTDWVKIIEIFQRSWTDFGTSLQLNPVGVLFQLFCKSQYLFFRLYHIHLCHNRFYWFPLIPQRSA